MGQLPAAWPRRVNAIGADSSWATRSLARRAAAVETAASVARWKRHLAALGEGAPDHVQRLLGVEADARLGRDHDRGARRLEHHPRVTGDCVTAANSTGSARFDG